MLLNGDFVTTETINLISLAYVIPNVKILIINTLENAYVKRNGITLHVICDRRKPKINF